MYFIYMDKKIFILLVLIIIIIYNLNYYKYNLNDINHYELFTLRENLTTFRNNISSGLSDEIKGDPSLIFTRDDLKSYLSIKDTANNYNMSKTTDHYIYVYNTKIDEKENQIIIDKNNKTYKLLKKECIDTKKEITIYSFYNNKIKDALKVFDDYISKITPPNTDKDKLTLPKNLITFRTNIINGNSDIIYGDPYLSYAGNRLDSYITIYHNAYNYKNDVRLDTDVLLYLSDPEKDVDTDQSNIDKYKKIYKHITTDVKEVNCTIGTQKVTKFIFYDIKQILNKFDSYISKIYPNY